MRALVYADLQATDGHEMCFTKPGKSLQLHRIEHFFDQLESIYKEHKCDALWDLGDTTDDRNSIPVPVIDLMCERLEKFDGEWNIKLVGNHEQFMRDTRIHAGKMFRRFFRVIDSCKALVCEKVNILCMSYHDDNSTLLEFMRPYRNKKPVILLGHFEMFGCQMPGGGQSASGIPRNLLDFVDIGLLGHIHKPQTQGNIHYVGSPFQQNWGESGENKRVAILDIKDGTIDLTWVPLTGFPVYRQVLLADYDKSVSPDSEDRYKVVLKSIQETEAFYAHPLANRADEAIYDYEQTVQTQGTETEQVIPRSKQDILKRYVQQNSLKDWNIVLDEESMVAYGDQISSGA